MSFLSSDGEVVVPSLNGDWEGPTTLFSTFLDLIILFGGQELESVLVMVELLTLIPIVGVNDP